MMHAARRVRVFPSLEFRHYKTLGMPRLLRRLEVSAHLQSFRTSMKLKVSSAEAQPALHERGGSRAQHKRDGNPWILADRRHRNVSNLDRHSVSRSHVGAIQQAWCI